MCGKQINTDLAINVKRGDGRSHFEPDRCQISGRPQVVVTLRCYWYYYLHHDVASLGCHAARVYWGENLLHCDSNEDPSRHQNSNGISEPRNVQVSRSGFRGFQQVDVNVAIKDKMLDRYVCGMGARVW